jgi:HTH-type transcriptional regulator/antitoxin HipB
MQVKNSKEVGALVREHRLRLKLSQAQLAQRIGVSRPWVILLEQGKRTAQMGLVLRTLDVLGLSLEIGPKASMPKSGGVDLDKLLKAKTTKGSA